MWSECVNVSEIKEKTNSSKGANAYWGGHVPTNYIRDKKNSFVWENKGHITQDHKKCFYGLI